MYDEQKMLHNVHPDLVRVFRRFQRLAPALVFEVRITCGERTLEEQKKNVARGASQTMKSRHIPQTNKSGHAEAIDLAAYANGKPLWDWPLYHKIAGRMKECARLEGVPIVWGGDWKTFKDGPHFELDRKVYK